ncbi:hypothetical protein A9Q79_08335 [Methylophaga sp. 42_25_T18]|nr:hypothetical protein A9Q79_08335 [Methylophaga sp. 42_25_T18]
MKLVWPLLLSLLIHSVIVQWKTRDEAERTGSSGRTALNIQKMKFVTAKAEGLSEQVELIDEPATMIEEVVVHDDIPDTPVIDEAIRTATVEKTVKPEIKKSLVKSVEKKHEKPKDKTRKTEKKSKKKQVESIEEKLKKPVEKNKQKQVKTTKKEIKETVKEHIKREDVEKKTEIVAKHDTDLMSDRKVELEVVSTSDSNTVSSGFNQIPTMAEPRYRKAFPPEYPRLARKRGQQGLVLLRAKVDQQGEVEMVELIQSSGVKSLDKRALETVGNGSFTLIRLLKNRQWHGSISR